MAFGERNSNMIATTEGQLPGKPRPQNSARKISSFAVSNPLATVKTCLSRIDRHIEFQEPAVISRQRIKRPRRIEVCIVNQVEDR